MKDILRRDSVSAGQIFEQYYANSGLDRDLIVELLNHVAAELSLPVDKLRPIDRFDVIATSWDSGYGILLFELQALAKKKGKQLSRIATIDDYLRAMAEVY